MNRLLILTICLYFVKLSHGNPQTSDNSKETSFIKEKLYSLTAWLGHEMFYTGKHSSENMALSGMSLMGTLLQMNSVASPQVSREIVAALGLAGHSPTSLCESFNYLVSAGSCYNRHNYSAVFYRNVFHDLSLEPSESHVGSTCFENYFSAIDFKERDEAINEINEWYSYLPPYSERIYLTELFRKKTRFVFVNLVKSTPLTNLGYRKGEEKIHFYNINGRILEFDSMYKVGEYYYEEHNGDYDNAFLREDLPGGRYSLVFIKAHSHSQISITKFKKIFTLETFKRDFEAALALTKKTNITLTLPQISINTTVDLRRPLENLCLTSLFTQDRALEKLFGSKSKVHEMPHVASFHFTADEGEQIETQNVKKVELDAPFWVILADREKKVPLNSALFLGFGGTDDSTVHRRSESIQFNSVDSLSQK